MLPMAAWPSTSDRKPAEQDRAEPAAAIVPLPIRHMPSSPLDTDRHEEQLSAATRTP
jgi:hypothetical protein